jgi:FAD dependent oxidoreductase
MRADVVIIGGGTGGYAAALGAARNGSQVIMTEETDWIGGQLTAQGLSAPDEHPWIEMFGATRAYRDYRDRVRDYYRHNYPLTAEARARWNLNPGNAWVSALCHEPRVALAVLHEMLAPYISSRKVTILLRHKAIAADTDGDAVQAVTVRDLGSGSEVTLEAPFFIDATELGDLLPLTKTEYVTGIESRNQTGELHAPEVAQPNSMQCITCCFVMDYLKGEDHTIEKPEEYDFWRNYVPKLTPPWPGKLISLRAIKPDTLKPYGFTFDPGSEDNSLLDQHPAYYRNLWSYRRLADKRNFVAGTYRGNITLVNWKQNDYWLGNICEVPEEEAERNLKRAKQLSLSLFYWLQTEAPRPDGGTGWPGLRLRKDLVGTEDGLAKYPYIRESRRIKAEFTILEQHVGTEARMKLTGKSQEDVTAETFADSVGVGSYRIDLHPSTGGTNYIDISSLPYQIPLGALIPQRVENLLAACKNIGTTHITNGCYRLHPPEWNIGESAGSLAAFCVEKKVKPRQVRNTASLLAEFQQLIQAQGVEIQWPRTRPR